MTCRNQFMPYRDYSPSVSLTAGRVISITVSCDACHAEREPPSLRFITRLRTIETTKHGDLSRQNWAELRLAPSRWPIV